MEESLDILEEIPMTQVQNQEAEERPVKSGRGRKPAKSKQEISEDEYPVNCLKNERIIVRHVNKVSSKIQDHNHILYGGMHENAVRWYTLPKLSSTDTFVNALTDAEKAYLEEVMGLEYNALSIYRKNDNYWENLTVRLTKQDNYLNLADPEDYIKYKVLLANKDYIASSIQELTDRPKATYEYVIIREGEEDNKAKKEMSATMRAYMNFGSIQEDKDKLRLIVETMEMRPYAKNTKLESLQTKVNKLIQSDAKLFNKIAEDPLLDTKILINNAVDAGIISHRGDFYYLIKDGRPLCDNNEDPTLSVAARYLNLPKHQDIKFAIEAQLKQ